MKFSQRYGYKPVREALQIEALDHETRVSLWNIFQLVLSDFKYTGFISERSFTEDFAQRTYIRYFKRPFDNCPRNWTSFLQETKHIFINYEWYEVLDFLEHAYESLENRLSGPLAAAVNKIFEAECVGYRFVAGQITPNANVHEVDEIEAAISTHDLVAEHISSALRFLSDRKHPEYRNSIKESISAVEACCRNVTNDQNATLAQALKVIEREHALHPSLKKAFNSLYGYTSDSGGIRHALKDDSSPTFGEAKYFLVSCSAFVNYVHTIYNAK